MDTPADLIAACTWIYEQGWAPATSGNFSLRKDADHAYITASGKHKGRLVPDDLLVSTLDGAIVGTAGPAATGKPSAETALHLALYRRFAEVGAVLHVHSLAATLVSQELVQGDRLVLQGWELLKALEGVRTHEAEVVLPVVDNTQDIDAMAAQIDTWLDTHPTDLPVKAYLIRGHGLYTWARDLEAACRHVEALDFVLRAELERARIAR